MILQGTILAVCVSEKKGVQKQPVEQTVLRPNHGIEGDAHAGPWHRQVSLLSYEKVLEFQAQGAKVGHGSFGENLVVSGIDFKSLPLGTLFQTGTIQMRLTQIGKECHSHCAIYQQMGRCIMPQEGVFAEVLTGGTIRPGDSLIALVQENPAGES